MRVIYNKQQFSAAIQDNSLKLSISGLEGERTVDRQQLKNFSRGSDYLKTTDSDAGDCSRYDFAKAIRAQAYAAFTWREALDYAFSITKSGEANAVAQVVKRILTESGEEFGPPSRQEIQDYVDKNRKYIPVAEIVQHIDRHVGWGYMDKHFPRPTWRALFPSDEDRIEFARKMLTPVVETLKEDEDDIFDPGVLKAVHEAEKTR